MLEASKVAIFPTLLLFVSVRDGFSSSGDPLPLRIGLLVRQTDGDWSLHLGTLVVEVGLTEAPL